MISKSQSKYIQSLGQKKHRDEEGVFVAEGPKLVDELAGEANVEILQLYGLESWVKGNEKRFNGLDVQAISEQELSKISNLSTPNQVLAVVRKFKMQKPTLKGKISLVLDTIQDPGNLGTIIRTADWFGVTDIVCSPDCADVYNPKVVQSTMGSIARVNVFYTDLPSWLQAQEMRIYGTTLDGKDVTKMKNLSEGLIVVGNEARGISDDVKQLANERITIPRKGKAESLNVAVATAIILDRLT